MMLWIIVQTQTRFINSFIGFYWYSKKNYGNWKKKLIQKNIKKKKNTVNICKMINIWTHDLEQGSLNWDTYDKDDWVVNIILDFSWMLIKKKKKNLKKKTKKKKKIIKNIQTLISISVFINYIR